MSNLRVVPELHQRGWTSIFKLDLSNAIRFLTWDKDTGTRKRIPGSDLLAPIPDENRALLGEYAFPPTPGRNYGRSRLAEGDWKWASKRSFGNIVNSRFPPILW